MAEKDESSMWGDLGDLEKVMTPTVYLREQADLLYEATKSVLRGEVTREASSGARFRVVLHIVAPRINYYRYTLLTVRHSLDPYPNKITDHVNSKEYECEDEEQFLSALKTIVSSPEVRHVIAMLISQSST